MLASKTVADRNRLAHILLAQSDAICTSEKGLMFKRQAEVNGYLSIAATALSTVSSIVTGDQAKSILSGGAAISSASRDHINTYAFYNQMMPALTKAIDNARTSKMTYLKSRLDDPIDKYSVDAMIYDVNAYHQLCSFTTAIQEVDDAVSKKQAYQAILLRANLETARLKLESERLSIAAAAAKDPSLKPQLDDIDARLKAIRKEDMETLGVPSDEGS